MEKKEKLTTSRAASSDLMQKRAEERQRKFLEERLTAGLGGKKEILNSLAEPQVKDVAADKINDVSRAQISNAKETMARNLDRGSRPTETLDYQNLKREFYQKQKQLDSVDRLAKLKSGLGKAGMGGLAAGLGAYSALSSGDAGATTPDYREAAIQGALGVGSALDPVGVVDAAAEIRRRLISSPEQVEKIRKEDYRSNIADRLGIQDSEIEAMGYKNGGTVDEDTYTKSMHNSPSEIKLRSLKNHEAGVRQEKMNDYFNEKETPKIAQLKDGGTVDKVGMRKQLLKKMIERK